MIAALALAVLVDSTPPKQPWFGPDKVKHFFVSALVQSVGFSAARAAGLDRQGSQAVGAGAVAVAGVWKEVRDRREGGRFSTSDLVWDAAGSASAAALLNGTR
jgi:putative lipoprotein